MVKLLAYFLFLLLLWRSPPVHAQPTAGKSAADIRAMVMHSKPDSNKILLLYELGRAYMKQVYSDRNDLLMDSAIEAFTHAMFLSDTVGMKNQRYESMLLIGEAWFHKQKQAEGKKLFFTVADIYHAQHDLQREARTWLRLGRKINGFPGSEQEVVGYFRKAIELYHLAGNMEREVVSRQYLGEHFFALSRYEQAEQELLKAVDLAEKNGVQKKAFMYYLLSAVNRYQAALDKSLLFANKCIESVRAVPDSVSLEMYYGELALVYDELDRIEESVEWYRMALDARIRQYGDRVEIFRTGGFLIRQLIKLGKGREALRLMDSLAGRFPPATLLEKATAAQNFAYCYDALHQYQRAQGSFEEMIDHYTKASYKDAFMAIASMDIGRFYLQHRQYARAYPHLNTALAYETAGPLSDRRELFQLLFVADSGLGNYGKAISDLLMYQQLNDSIFNERKSRQIEQLTIQFETAKKEQSIQALKREKNLQEHRLQQEKRTRGWMLGAVVLLVVILFLMVNRARLKQRTNTTLKNQQKEIKRKNAALENLVEEKEWLIREIHHRVKNNFHIVQGLLGTQSGYLTSEEAIRALNDSRHRVQAMSIIHQKLYQLDNLTAINIAAYIHDLVSHLRSSFNVRQQIQFNLDIDAVEMNVSYCIPVGLILNEAITNSLKYAFPDGRAGIVRVSLKHIRQDFIICIEDNGIGLPSGYSTDSPATMGLRLMKGLSEDIEAHFFISGDAGTKIVLEFSYEPGPYPTLTQTANDKSV